MPKAFYNMKKIIIIGCPGSGKSRLSIELQKITGLPLFHLDNLFWNEDKTTVERSVFDQKLSEILKKSEWIIDGNYSRTMELRLSECDTVIFLDFDTYLCLQGIAERKGKPRPDMPWVEGEEVDPEFLEYVRNFKKDCRPEIMRLLSKYPEKKLFTLKNRTEVDEFLKKQIILTSYRNYIARSAP